jgi:hypothetical protein
VWNNPQPGNRPQQNPVTDKRASGFPKNKKPTIASWVLIRSGGESGIFIAPLKRSRAGRGFKAKPPRSARLGFFFAPHLEPVRVGPNEKAQHCVLGFALAERADYEP